MKTVQLKFKILLFLLFAGFALTSCSSDDDSYPNPDDNDNGNNKISSYSITVGGTEYSNSWNSEEDNDKASIYSIYVINDNGEKEISLSLLDGKNDIDVGTGFNLKNGQPLPLIDTPDGSGSDPGEDFSFVNIEVGDISYHSFTGTAILSNLKMKGIESGIGGLATYDLEVDGVFRKFDPSEPYLEPEDREQIQVTATFHIRSNI